MTEAAVNDKYTLNVSGKYEYSALQEMMEYINELREEQGAGKLVLDKELTDVAMQRAAETAYLFSHTRPDGTMCYTASSIMHGENIAAGYPTASDVFVGWKNSQGHYENMIRSTFKKIGIGHFVHNGRSYWVQVFSEYTSKTTETRTGEVEVSVPINIVESEKTVTVKNTTTTSKTIKSLKAKKKYYIKIRTYKTVKGINYYSAWSAKKSITTK